LRFNKIAAFTKYYQHDGSGLGTFEDRLKPMLEASKKLLKAYPDYGIILTRKSGMTEFKLRKIPARNESNHNDNKQTNVNTTKNVNKKNLNTTKKNLNKKNTTKKNLNK
jgi:hypothetical protein